MFFEAQKRFENSQRNGRFTSNYVRDVLRNYGDGGKPMRLPKQDHGAFQRAVQFREAEKQRYRQTENDLHIARQNYNSAHYEIFQLRERNKQLEKRLHDALFPETDAKSDDPGVAGRRDNDTRSDSGRGALPPASDSSQTDTDAGQPATLISSSKLLDDGSADDRSSGPRVDNAERKNADTAGCQDGTQRADTGRPLPDETDGA